MNIKTADRWLKLKRVMITGGTGFIGSWLVKEFLGNEVEVLLLIRNNSMATAKKVNGSQIRYICYDSDEYNRLPYELAGSIDVF